MGKKRLTVLTFLSLPLRRSKYRLLRFLLCKNQSPARRRKLHIIRPADFGRARSFRCSSFGAKMHARLACSLASALTTARCRCVAADVISFVVTFGHCSLILSQLLCRKRSRSQWLTACKRAVLTPLSLTTNLLRGRTSRMEIINIKFNAQIFLVDSK